MTVTSVARKHLTKAVDYLKRGHEFYLLARLEIIAARDAGATFTEIGEAVGHDRKWVSRIIEWDGSPETTPFDNAKAKASREKYELGRAKQLLRDHPELLAPEIADAVDKLASTGAPQGTMAGAITVPEVQMKQAVVRSKHDRMAEIRDGIRAVASMDVDEFVKHSNWEYDSEHAPSLRTIGRDLDAAIDKLQTLRNRITARLLEING